MNVVDATIETLLIAWIAIQTYMSLYYAILYTRYRGDPEHLYFAVITLGIAVWCAGAAMRLFAVDAADIARSLRVQSVGSPVMLAGFVAFALSIVDERRPRFVAGALTCSALGLSANLAGFFYDPAIVAASANTPGGPNIHVDLLLPGQLYIASGWVVGMSTIVILSRHAKSSTDVRSLVVLALPACAGGFVDAVRQFGSLQYLGFFDHSMALTAMGWSYVLMRRMVRSADELAQKTNELRRSYRERRTLHRQLVRNEQLAAVGELSAVIAHEVRNPLTILKNAAAGLHRDELDAADRETLLSIVDEETDRLNRLVRDLLAYAKPVTPQRKTFEIGALVREAVTAASKAHPRASALDFALQLEETPVTLEGDPDMLRGALTNIVENALQAMPDGGELTVRSEAAKVGPLSAILLVFSDTGEGMDTLVRSKARDPFFTTRPSGTGLGLAIVERVIRAHGGTLELKSRYGGGTTVQVTLPLAPPTTDF